MRCSWRPHLPRGAAGPALIVAVALGGLAAACSPEPAVPGGSSSAPEAQGDAGSTGDVAQDAGLDTQATEAPLSTTVQVSNAQQGARVELEGVVLSSGEVVVKVWLRSFADLYGLATHLRFDPKALELTYAVGEPILAGQGFSGRTVLAESPPGRLLMGGARFRVKTRPWDSPEGTVVGQQLWATLRFKVLAAGAHTVGFDPAHTVARDGQYGELSVSWGSLVVTRPEEVQP